MARGISCATDKLKGGLNSRCFLLQALHLTLACGNLLPVKPFLLAKPALLVASRSGKGKATMATEIHQDRQRKQPDTFPTRC